MHKMKMVLVLMLIFSGMANASVVYFWSSTSGDWSSISIWSVNEAPATYLPSPTSVNQDIAITIGDVTVNVTTDGQGAIDMMGGYHTGNSVLNVAVGKRLQITHTAQVGCGSDTDALIASLTLNVYGTFYSKQLRVGDSLMDSGIVNVYDGGSLEVDTWGCTVGKVDATTGTGTINLKGGTMTVNSGLTINPKGRIDIDKGTLKVLGDVRTLLQGYITAGKITSRSGLSPHCVPEVSYLNGYTYVKTGGCTCTTYIDADMNQDCYVDFADFALFAQEWLICYDSENPECLPSPCATLETKSHQAIIPASKSDTWWQQRHTDILSQIATHNPVDLIFIGDSITQNIKPEIWSQYYASYNPLNLGFSGDMTQNVLWRLENGEISGISPKLAVVLIGTNNTYPPAGQVYTSEEIADGIMAICCKVRRNLPNTKILILAIFPRGQYPSAERNKNAAASILASQIADNETIFYMDINSNFLNPDGSLPANTFPDFIHPSLAGDVIWAEAIKAKVQYLMSL